MSKNFNIARKHKRNIKLLDESTVEIVRGINELIVKSENANLVTVAHILGFARTQIAIWAANEDYQEPDSMKMS